MILNKENINQLKDFTYLFHERLGHGVFLLKNDISFDVLFLNEITQNTNLYSLKQKFYYGDYYECIVTFKIKDIGLEVITTTPNKQQELLYLFFHSIKNNSNPILEIENENNLLDSPLIERKYYLEQDLLYNLDCLRKNKRKYYLEETEEMESTIKLICNNLKTKYNEFVNLEKIIYLATIYSELIHKMNSNLIYDSSVHLGCDCGCGGDSINEYDYEELEKLETREQSIKKKIFKLLNN